MLVFLSTQRTASQSTLATTRFLVGFSQEPCFHFLASRGERNPLATGSHRCRSPPSSLCLCSKLKRTGKETDGHHSSTFWLREEAQLPLPFALIRRVSRCLAHRCSLSPIDLGERIAPGTYHRISTPPPPRPSVSSTGCQPAMALPLQSLPRRRRARQSPSRMIGASAALPLVVAAVRTANAFSYYLDTPTQCGDLNVSWKDGVGPYQLLLVPVSRRQRQRPCEWDAR